MIRNPMHVLATALALSVLLASSAEAQSIDAAGGYAYLEEHVEDLAAITIKKGWFGAIGFNLNDSFAVFGQVSGHYRTIPIGAVNVDTTLYIYGGGPRFTGNQRSNVTWFAQALVGQSSVGASVEGRKCEECSEKHFAFQPAVGVDVKAAGSIGIRFQGGITFIRAEDPDTTLTVTQREYHLMVGIVVRGG